MADQEADNYPIRSLEEGDTSNSQFPDASETLAEEDVSVS